MDHATEIQAVALWVVIGVALDSKASTLKDPPMVLPGRVTNRDSAIWAEPAEVFRSHPKAPSSTEGINGHHPATCKHRTAIAEKQCLYGLVIGGRPINGLIATGQAFGDPGLFGPFYGPQQGQLALVVVINPNAEVHFFGPLIGKKGFS